MTLRKTAGSLVVSATLSFVGLFSPGAAESDWEAPSLVTERTGALARGDIATTWGNVDASGLAVEGGVWDFEGGPLGTLQGWTSIDRTDLLEELGVVPVRRVTSSDFLSGGGADDGTITAGGSSGSVWMGAFLAETTEDCWPGGQGYSNGWRLQMAKLFEYSGSGDVTIKVDYFTDSDSSADFSYVYIVNELGVKTGPYNSSMNGNAAGKGWSGSQIELNNLGTPSMPVNETITVAGSAFVGGGGSEFFDVLIEFESDHLNSDGLDAFSAFLNTTVGALGVDDIHVTGTALDDLSDFESGADGWGFFAELPVGNLMQVADLATLDPVGDPVDCPLSGNVLIAAVTDPKDPRFSHPERQNEIMTSPPIYVGGHPDEDRLVQFDIWEELPLANAVGLRVGLHYYPWVCFADPGAGARWTIEPADTTSGTVRLTGYEFDSDFGGPTCDTITFDMTGTVPADVDSVKIVLEILQSCSDFDPPSCTGPDQTNQSPYIDNVQLVSISRCGTNVWTANEVASAPSRGPQGSAWGDYDGDGDQDLYVVQIVGSNILYRNDAGVLVDVTVAPLDDIGAGTCARWADADNDSDLDLYLVNADGPNRFFRSDGGTYVDAATGVMADAGFGTSMTWIDYEADGDLDLYLINADEPNKVILNVGGGYLESTDPLFDFSEDGYAAWGDVDDDGIMDVYLGVNGGANRLLFGTGGGAFTEYVCCGLDDFGSVGSVSWSDYDNDGDLDLYVSRLSEQNLLFRNELGPAFRGNANRSGSALFTELSSSVRVDDPDESVSAIWLDADNDGDQDLYVVNAFTPALYRNDGTVFATVTPVDLGESSNGAAAADHDSDGDVDIYSYFLEARGQLVRNRLCPGPNWLDVRLIGTASNRSGIGARVSVFSGATTQVREYTAASGRSDQNGTSLHFGLGADTVDDLVIRWPSGLVERRPAQGAPAIPVNSTVWAIEGEGIVLSAGAPSPALATRFLSLRPNPFNPRVDIAYELARAGAITLGVFDANGRLVTILDSGTKAAGRGTTTWDGRDTTSRPAASGVYFVRLTSTADAGVEQATRKIVLAR